MDFRAYERLALFNRNLDRALALLPKLEQVAPVHKRTLRLSALQIEESKSLVNHAVAEALGDLEAKRAASAYRKRVALEERLRARNS